jgi:hypothetical protein
MQHLKGRPEIFAGIIKGVNFPGCQNAGKRLAYIKDLHEVFRYFGPLSWKYPAFILHVGNKKIKKTVSPVLP